MNRAGTPTKAPWLGRFELPALLRTRGAFHLGSTREHEGGEARLVVFGAPGRDARQQRLALANFERAHRLVSHPRIAPVAGSGEHEGVPFVALDCDAVADLTLVLREVRRAGHTVPYAQGDGFVRGLREALQAAHAVSAQETPLCIGTLTYGNVLFSRSGRHWLVGFGHNVITHDEAGGLLGGEPVFQAPEVVVGGASSPSADFVALIMMMRSVASVARLVSSVTRVIAGNTLPEDLELLTCLLSFEQRLMAAHPSQRASISEAVAISDRIRTLLGVIPDPEGFEQEAATALARLLPEPTRGELRVGPDAAWIKAPDGSLQQLGNRAALRRVLLSLVEARLQSPGRALSLDVLIEAGWRGEQLPWETGVNRAYVLLSELRRMGLRSVLQRHDDGYRLDPKLLVHLDASLARDPGH